MPFEGEEPPSPFLRFESPPRTLEEVLNSTVVGVPGHPVRVEGIRPEGPDADWAHLPDPVADAVKILSARVAELERRLAERDGSSVPAAVVPLRPRRGPDPAGG